MLSTPFRLSLPPPSTTWWCWCRTTIRRITIYREPLLEMCSSEQEVVDEVTITVIHEIAHHFGIDDERLHQLGWG
ncbi:putative zinc metalloprotease [Mycobacteroides abscessus subsp. abscessus]|nr:putative zinc metalloprotease [Mycobacteroides abscessus subsp. abscessus]